MILLLPDFIGHPGCFRRLLAGLSQPVQQVNYHQLARSESLPEMARLVASTLSHVPEWIVGYSFGGALGFELAQLLPQTPRLLMIDSHLPTPLLRETSSVQQFEYWLTAKSREWITLMEELGEIDRSIVLQHIYLFSRWQPFGTLREAWLVRCPSDSHQIEEHWQTRIRQLHLLQATLAHHEVMHDPIALAAISTLLKQESH